MIIKLKKAIKKFIDDSNHKHRCEMAKRPKLYLAPKIKF